MLIEFQSDDLNVTLRADGEYGSPVDLIRAFNEFIKHLAYFEDVFVSIVTKDEDEKQQQLGVAVGDFDIAGLMPIGDEI